MLSCKLVEYAVIWAAAGFLQWTLSADAAAGLDEVARDVCTWASIRPYLLVVFPYGQASQPHAHVGDDIIDERDKALGFASCI